MTIWLDDIGSQHGLRNARHFTWLTFRHMVACANPTRRLSYPTEPLRLISGGKYIDEASIAQACDSVSRSQPARHRLCDARSRGALDSCRVEAQRLSRSV